MCFDCSLSASKQFSFSFTVSRGFPTPPLTFSHSLSSSLFSFFDVYQRLKRRVSFTHLHRSRISQFPRFLTALMSKFIIIEEEAHGLFLDNLRLRLAPAPKLAATLADEGMVI